MHTWRWKYFNVSFVMGGILFFIAYYSLVYNYYSYRVLGHHEYDFIVTIFSALLISYPLGFVGALFVLRYVLKEQFSLLPSKDIQKAL